MFTHIRWRLVGWIMLVLGAILVLLGAAVYAAAERTLLQQVDRNLVSRSNVEGPAFGAVLRGGQGQREGYRGGVFYLALDPNGTIVANPQRVNIDPAVLAGRAGPGGSFITVSIDGEPVRIFLRRLGPNAPAGAALAVGQSLASEEIALQSLLFVLVAGGILGLVLSLAGAWFLAGRALVPIELAFQRQQEFVADASHELRTPLTVLHSATDLLNQHRDEPLAANTELFDDIRSEIVRMERLTSDLLTLARSDRKELQLAVAPVSIAALVGEVVQRLQSVAAAGDVTLASGAIRDNPVVEADPDRLQQVLLVLLDNALKHTPSGGKVTVTARRREDRAIIEVADTGAGIQPEHMPRIFDRFYRVDAARSRRNAGSGLGLPIARALVQAHGGELTLTSAPGEGTRAIVSLPAIETPAKAELEAAEAAPGASSLTS
ncbi:MAG TPA: ATP-binding protein [Chloroflexota bacterium]|jgi:signal transduction histidine kinase|nr:ATP-binding protein [Chloroflexota bacterium]